MTDIVFRLACKLFTKVSVAIAFKKFPISRFSEKSQFGKTEVSFLQGLSVPHFLLVDVGSLTSHG